MHVAETRAMSLWLMRMAQPMLSKAVGRFINTSETVRFLVAWR